MVITPIFGPRRSSSALVPTVVPCTIERDGRGTAERGETLLEEPGGLVAAARRDLAGAEAAACLVEQEQVGEGAADVDTDDDAG